MYPAFKYGWIRNQWRQSLLVHQITWYGDKSIKILDSTSKEQGLLGLIVNHFRRLFFIATSGLENKDLANLLGVKEYAIAKQRSQTINFSKMQLKKIYSLLEEIDFNIKSGAMLQENALYYLVLSILYI